MPKRQWLMLGALAGTAACGGPLSRATAAYEEGEFQVAETEARRAQERGQTGADLVIIDALIAQDELATADEVLAGLEEASVGQIRARSMAIAELDADARRYATEWRAAFEAGSTLPAPQEVQFLGAVFIRLINDSQAAAIALLGELPQQVGEDPELVATIDSALDVALYQMHYRGDVRAVQGAVRAFRTVLGERYVLSKHEVAAALYRVGRMTSSSRRELGESIDALTGGGSEEIAELAQEFATRGAYPAGAAAFHLAAEASDEFEPRWLRGAANAEYLAGEIDDARESLEAATSNGEGLTAAYDVALRHRDTAHLFAFVIEASEAPCSDRERAATGELLRARTDIAANRIDQVTPRIQGRLAECELEGLAATVGMALVDSGDFAGAEPLLRHAALLRPEEPELVATYLYVSDEAAIDAYRLQIVGLAVGTLRPDLSTPAVLGLLGALERSSDPGVSALADELLREAVARSPGDFALVAALAQSLVDAGYETQARDALSLYTAAADDELAALIGAARWMSSHVGNPLYIASAYEDVATHPESDRVFSALQDRSAAEFAWLQAARSYAFTEGGEGTLTAIWGFVEAAGADDPATWQELWGIEELFRVLQPRDVLVLGERAAAMGIPMAEVQMRLGAAYVERGETAAAQVAYTAALAEDPSRLSEVMRWLDRVDDRAVLISVLHATDPAERPFQVWAALADAHAEEASRTGLSRTTALEHRVDARLAFQSAMTVNPNGSFRAQTFAEAELYDVAAEIHLQDLEEDPSDMTSLQLSLLSLAASGASRERMDPLIGRALDEFEEAALSRLRVALHQSHYVRDALDVGRRQLQLEARTAEALEATAASVIGYAIELDEIEEAGQLIELYFTYPASRLAESDGIPPARYRSVRDRDARAAALMGTASRLYERAGLWALATQTSIRRLELSASSSHLILDRALVSSVRMTGGEIALAQLERIAGAAGGGPEAWRALGASAQGIERPEVAIRCWSRVLELVPDDWSAELELGQLRASAGEPDRALGHFQRAIRGARGDGRDAQTALHAASTFSRVGRGDLAVEVLEEVPNSTEVSLRLADYELAAGFDARATRRLARTGMPPGETARIYLRHGYFREGVDLWQRRATSMSPQAAATLLERYTDEVFEALPFSEALALIETTVGRAGTRDPARVRSELLGRAGRPLEGAAVLEASLAGGGANETWRDLAALYAAGNEWGSARQAAENGTDTTADPRWTLTALELQSGLAPSEALGRSPQESLAFGNYGEVLALSLSASPSGEERAGHAEAMRALAANGFDDEARALLRPTIRGRFEVGAWLVAAGIGGDEVVAAAQRRGAGEATLTAELAREFMRAERYDAADELLEDWTGYGNDFDAIAGAQFALMQRVPGSPSERVERWIANEADEFWIASAARDAGLASVAAEVGQSIEESDEALLWRFELTYWSGNVTRATDELVAALPTARMPFSLLVRAMERVHPVLDREPFRRLLDHAIELRPGELEFLMERALLDDAESRVGMRALRESVACNSGGLTHALSWLVHRGADQTAVALADACPDLSIRAEVLVGLASGELPNDLDDLQVGQAIGFAALANERGQSDLAVALAARAQRASNSAAAAGHMALALARRGDVDAAAVATNTFLREAYDLTAIAPELLAALSEAGALESADLVAQAIRRTPGIHSQMRGGAPLVIASLATGNPRAGVRYVETELPNVLRFAAAAGLTVRVASLLAAAGASDEAMAVYEAHLSLWPHDPTAQNNLAFLMLEHTDEFVAAEQLARSAILNAGRISSSVADTLAWALHLQGRHSDALDFAGQALRLSASEPGFDPRSESQAQLLDHWAQISEAANSDLATDDESTTTPAEGRRRRQGRRR